MKTAGANAARCSFNYGGSFDGDDQGGWPGKCEKFSPTNYQGFMKRRVF